MPTYEYKCTQCDVVFDEFQSITAKPLTDCPKCKKKNALKRLIGGGAGILFKGSGFYQTDYRSSSYKKGVEKESKPAASKSDKKEPKKKQS